MSDYTVLAELGDALVALLFQELNGDDVVKNLIDGESRISLLSPAELKNDDSVRLSIYLYRIVEDPYMKNRFPVEAKGGGFKAAPLALDLHYLLTPLLGTPREQQVVLGKAMQVLYDRAILTRPDFSGSLATSGEEIRLILNPVALEETTRIWQALELSYRLSVCYTARVVLVDSEDEMSRQRIVFRGASYGVVPETS
jgi:hypothetical protein